MTADTRPLMPELPEVETVKRGLAPTFEGALIAKVDQNRPDLRFPFPDGFADRLTGRRLTVLSRRSKYLLGDVDSGDVLVMHLGMSGSFRIENDLSEDTPGAFAHARSKDPKHDHVVFHLETVDGGRARIVYNDPRRFGFMDLIARPVLADHPFFRELGLEPLGNDLGGETLARLFNGRKTPLKAALLNQKLIAGLGNIYVCEALWRTGLSPERAAGTLVTKTGKPTKRRKNWPPISAPPWKTPSGRAGPRCAITPRQTAHLATFSTRLPSTTAKAKPAGHQAARAPSPGWSSPTGQPSTARPARADLSYRSSLPDPPDLG